MTSVIAGKEPFNGLHGGRCLNCGAKLDEYQTKLWHADGRICCMGGCKDDPGLDFYRHLRAEGFRIYSDG